MSSFRVPSFLRPRHSFHQLRSFHLSPNNQPLAQQLAQFQIQASISKRNNLVESNQTQSIPFTLPQSGIIPLNSRGLLCLAIVLSFFFIASLSCAFVGSKPENSRLGTILNKVAETGPGIVLIGENVDVDIDEPSVTIRWAILACGDEFTLPGSIGLHGSTMCGLPKEPLDIFVDGDASPTATYNPVQIPFNRDSGSRRSIQNLVQFDSDHVLDVHEARLYPFDTYFLSSTLRAKTSNNVTVPIRQLATIDLTSNFIIETSDVESYGSPTNGTQEPSRDIDMYISRPGEARAFTLLLFIASWVLTHVTVGHVIIARMLSDVKPILKHLVSTGAILVAIPQLRNSMPDAPGLDGVLIDCIGFFPQMIISAAAAIILLLILAVREFDLLGHARRPQTQVQLKTYRGSRPPSIPTERSTSKEITQYDLHRLVKHLKGQYVFPPVQAMHEIKPSNKLQHRRCQTLSKIMEAGELHR